MYSHWYNPGCGGPGKCHACGAAADAIEHRYWYFVGNVAGHREYMSLYTVGGAKVDVYGWQDWPCTGIEARGAVICETKSKLRLSLLHSSEHILHIPKLTTEKPAVV